MTADEVINDLKKLYNSNNIKGMAKFGIETSNAFGISVKNIRMITKDLGTDQKLALELWNSGIHEARILASLISDPKRASKSQIDRWVRDFNSWDLCDLCCNNLIRKTPYAVEFSFTWPDHKSEFIRRAGFVMIAVLAVHKKDLSNEDISKYFPIILKYSTDDRNFVKKSVNWALRQIGKRNLKLNGDAIKVAEELVNSENQTARWIGKDAYKELTSEKIQIRLK